MKKLFAIALLLSTACMVMAKQSTCKSRCEEELGVGDSRCNFCKDVREPGSKRPEKKPVVDASASSASVATTQPPKKEDVPPSSSSVPPVKKNN